MAHQMPPSVNCSLDDIDLTALKVSASILRCPDLVFTGKAFRIKNGLRFQHDRLALKKP